MAKKTNFENNEQFDLFPHNPEIRGFGITEFKLSGAVITGKIAAATEAYDAAQLTPERWAEAAAMWILRLLHGDYHKIRAILDRKHSDYWDEAEAREKDEKIGFSRVSMAPLPDEPAEPAEPAEPEIVASLPDAA